MEISNNAINWNINLIAEFKKFWWVQNLKIFVMGSMKKKSKKIGSQDFNK